MKQMTYEELWAWYGTEGKKNSDVFWKLWVTHSNANPGIAEYEVNHDIPLGQLSLVYVYENFTGEKLEVVVK